MLNEGMSSVMGNEIHNCHHYGPLCIYIQIK